MYLGSVNTENDGPIGLKHFLRSRTRVDDGQLHTVVVTKIKERAELQVNDGPRDDSALGSNVGLDIEHREHLFIGGLDGDIFQETEQLFSQGFDGCVQSFNVQHWGASSFGADIDFNSDKLVYKKQNIFCKETC